VPFKYRDGCALVRLSREIQQAQESYLMVQRTQVGQKLSLSHLKLASPSRLHMVHKHSLPGVPFERIERPIFSNSFVPHLDFYRLALGEEWRHALHEGALAFYQPPQLEGFNFYLYWHTS
jgi:type VI secretion system protein ImpJ